MQAPAKYNEIYTPLKEQYNWLYRYVTYLLARSIDGEHINNPALRLTVSKSVYSVLLLFEIV